MNISDNNTLNCTFIDKQCKSGLFCIKSDLTDETAITVNRRKESLEDSGS